MNKLKKIVNKISSLKSVFTPADKYNELIDNHNELITVVEELSNNSGGGGTTNLFTDTTANQFVKTNSTNDGLQSLNLFENTTASKFVKTNSSNMGFESVDLFANTSGNQFLKTNIANNGLYSIDLFAQTVADQVLTVNSGNNGFSSKDLNAELYGNINTGYAITQSDTGSGFKNFDVYLDKDSEKVLIGEDPIQKNSQITTNSVVIGGNTTSYVSCVYGSSTRNNIIGINAININTDNTIAIGNSTYATCKLHGNIQNVCQYVSETTSRTLAIIALGKVNIYNNSTNAITTTFLGSVSDFQNEYQTFQGIVTFYVDNTKATTGNNYTIAFSDSSISVNGTDSLVVSSGTVGKFELYMYYDGAGEYKGKVCRVY